MLLNQASSFFHGTNDVAVAKAAADVDVKSLVRSGSEKSTTKTKTGYSFAELASIIKIMFDVSLRDFDIGQLIFGMHYLARAHRKQRLYDDISGTDAISESMVDRLLYAAYASRAAYCETTEKLCAHSPFQIENVKEFHPKSRALRPAWYVAVDHDREAVVWCFRGTATIKDYITDLAGKEEQYCGGYVHWGMLQAAKWFASNRLDLVVQQLQENPGYELLLLGHSLGAGTAALLCHLLVNDEIYKAALKGIKISCIGVATPCVMSHRLALSCADYVTSLVCTHDVVPRFSVRKLLALKDEILALSWRSMVLKDVAQPVRMLAEAAQSHSKACRTRLRADTLTSSSSSSSSALHPLLTSDVAGEGEAAFRRELLLAVQQTRAARQGQEDNLAPLPHVQSADALTWSSESESSTTPAEGQALAGPPSRQLTPTSSGRSHVSSGSGASSALKTPAEVLHRAEAAARRRVAHALHAVAGVLHIGNLHHSTGGRQERRQHNGGAHVEREAAATAPPAALRVTAALMADSGGAGPHSAWPPAAASASASAVPIAEAGGRTTAVSAPTPPPAHRGACMHSSACGLLHSHTLSAVRPHSGTQPGLGGGVDVRTPLGVMSAGAAGFISNSAADIAPSSAASTASTPAASSAAGRGSIFSRTLGHSARQGTPSDRRSALDMAACLARSPCSDLHSPGQLVYLRRHVWPSTMHRVKHMVGHYLLEPQLKERVRRAYGVLINDKGEAVWSIPVTDIAPCTHNGPCPRDAKAAAAARDGDDVRRQGDQSPSVMEGELAAAAMDVGALGREEAMKVMDELDASTSSGEGSDSGGGLRNADGDKAGVSTASLGDDDADSEGAGALHATANGAMKQPQVAKAAAVPLAGGAPFPLRLLSRNKARVADDVGSATPYRLVAGARGALFQRIVLGRTFLSDHSVSSYVDGLLQVRALLRLDSKLQAQNLVEAGGGGDGSGLS